MTYRVCRTYEYGFFMLILTIMLTLSGCGNWKGKDSGNENALGNNTAVNDGVETADAENPIQYTKRFQELTMPINTYYFQIVGQRLYAASMDYNTGIFKRYYMEELDGSASYAELMSSSSIYQEVTENCIGFFVDEEEYLYFILCKKDELEEQQYYLCKCTSEGQELFRTDVTEQLGFAYDNWNSYQSAAVDRNGRIYIATQNYIFLYDENGEYHGLLEDTHVCSIARGRDGSVYYTKSKSMAIAVGATLDLVKVDFEGSKVAAIYSDFPTGYNYASLWPGMGYDFLIIDEKYLYGYQLETQTTEQILIWSDAYMKGQNLMYAGEQENGKLLLIEWQTPLQLVSLTVQDELYDGWSAKISKLEKELSDFAGSELFVDIGEYYIVTEEDVEYIRKLIQNASTIDSTNLYSNIVMQIIEEEAESYFVGDKSVEEVTEIIQKRIQLYLDENF